jgi:hypothetical protein
MLIGDSIPYLTPATIAVNQSHRLHIKDKLISRTSVTLCSISNFKDSCMNMNISLNFGECIVAALLHQYQQQTILVAYFQIQVLALLSYVLVPKTNQPSEHNLSHDILRDRLAAQKNSSHPRFVVAVPE